MPQRHTIIEAYLSQISGQSMDSASVSLCLMVNDALLTPLK